MKTIFLICLSLIPYLVWGNTIKSTIHSLSLSSMIRFNNGRVAFLSSEQESLLPLIQEASKRGDLVEVKVDNEQNLISILTLKEGNIHLKRFNLMEETTPPITFEPSVIPSYNEAVTIFKRLNKNWARSSECSNRAHIWAHDEFTNHGIKSQKAFVFFTASYINRNRFKWWFHVAPLLTVKENGKLEKRVLDVMFSHKPQTIKEWTDNFVFSKRPCKVTTKFSEYDVNPQTEDCYFITSPMYYWTPKDIHNEEIQNRYKSDFSQGEIKTALGEAFKFN